MSGQLHPRGPTATELHARLVRWEAQQAMRSASMQIGKGLPALKPTERSVGK